MKALKFKSFKCALQHLADYTGQHIRIATEEWSDLPTSDSMYDQLEAIYELEYKYHQMKNKADKWKGLPQRYDKTLEGMGDSIIDIASDVAGDLLPVFEDWLENHALMSAEKWAKQRVKMLDDYRKEEALAEIEGEYKRYKGGAFENDISAVIIDHLDEINGLTNWLDDLGKEIKDQEMEMKKEEDGKNFDEEKAEKELEYLDDPEEVWDYQVVNGGMEYMISLIPDYAIDDIYFYLYKDLVFPHWLSHWEAEGIEATRDRVEETTKIIQQIKNKSIDDIGKITAGLNRALNEAHQTGSMLEYISDHYEISKSDLDNLSDMDVADWNKELKNMGLKVAKKEIKMAEEMCFKSEDEALQKLADITGKTIKIGNPELEEDEGDESVNGSEIGDGLREKGKGFTEAADKVDSLLDKASKF